MSKNTDNKVIAGGTDDLGLGANTLADAITFQVNIVPISKEGVPLSSAELNRLRIGNGLGQFPSSSYGTSTPKKAKAPKKSTKGAKSNV